MTNSSQKVPKNKDFLLLPKIFLTNRQLCDLELILNGGFSPLTGFLNEKDYLSVLSHSRLSNGVLWPIPITLDVEGIEGINLGEEILLCDASEKPVAKIFVESIYKPDKKKEAQQVYATQSRDHFGVKYLFDKTNDFYIGGKIEGLGQIEHFDYGNIRKTPKQLKRYFKKKGISKIIGFQTRNPIHQAHFWMIKKAAEIEGAHVLIHPSVGETKDGDIDYITRIKCYKLVNKKYAKDFTTLSLYQTTLALPSGYDIIGTNGGTSSSGNTINSTPLSSNSTLVYCIAPLNPWFQTNVGDVRFLNLSNPVPAGLYASTDVNYPGIFYSSDSSANLGNGAASVKNWVINNEYSYNSDTENRNGGMSYDFYKSKTKQDGGTVTSISSGTFDQTQITGSGVYESPSDLTINLYSHVNGRRVVILVNGNVTINASTISILQNQGIFIVAAKGNITIAKTIGTSTLSSTASNLDGYYSAQGSIIVDGDTCPDTVTPDLRLNVGGALIANSLKPFATSGTGTVQNRRSFCVNNLLYPSLYIGSRPDFLTQLTDFYKTSYTKWQEVSP